MAEFSFSVTQRDQKTQARLGICKTPHGVIKTPAFVAVGTQASVKAIAPDDLKTIGTQVIIANTYHLLLRPGEELIHQMGGLHRFMGWNGPMMTDSGGFQVFSLGAGNEHGVGKIASIFPEEQDPGGHLHPAARGESLVKLSEEGVEFRSHIDGSKRKFTPESVIEIQRKLGADIILVLDECTSPLHDYEYTRRAMERTHRWAKRALDAFQGKSAQGSPQAIYGIIQGGAYQDLRFESAKFIANLGFDGIAIGGSLGKSKREMHQVLEWTMPLLPTEKTVHLLGIGTIEDIFEAVERGIDTFDCVAPTRQGRTGWLLCRESEDFQLNIYNSQHRQDSNPIDPSCDCYTCQHHSRAYLQHLFKAREPLAMRLATLHNLRFLEKLMEEIRAAIANGTLKELKNEWLKA
ncbi:tRNA guanosine(34) transglycosylase Tgt [Candidatus Acetothermia bacterium]|nr:tRNA guanosine(34) transglycosylase Tgt [Candidatus Acetothermia bacterium]